MKEEIKKHKIVQTKVWTITSVVFDDGSYSLHRENDGFTAHELLGLCAEAQLSIMKQIDVSFKSKQAVPTTNELKSKGKSIVTNNE